MSKVRSILLAAALAYAPQAAAEVEVFRDADSGLLSWKAQHPGFSLQFIQVLPDYIRATYSARGLPPAFVELMAKQCIFGTIIKNESDDVVSYRVKDWRYIGADGIAQPVKTKSRWLDEWADMGVVFRWSLLPDDQRFAPGDWSQGFTTLPLPPGSRVKLLYRWTRQGETHEGLFDELYCAPNEAPER